MKIRARRVAAGGTISDDLEKSSRISRRSINGRAMRSMKINCLHRGALFVPIMQRHVAATWLRNNRSGLRKLSDP